MISQILAGPINSLVIKTAKKTELVWLWFLECKTLGPILKNKNAWY